MIANYISSKSLIFKIYMQLIQTNIKEKSNQIKKWVEELNRHLFQRKHTDGQQVHKRMLTLANHLGNANQNHEILPHTCQNVYHQKTTNNKCCQGCSFNFCLAARYQHLSLLLILFNPQIPFSLRVDNIILVWTLV